MKRFYTAVSLFLSAALLSCVFVGCSESKNGEGRVPDPDEISVSVAIMNGETGEESSELGTGSASLTYNKAINSGDQILVVLSVDAVVKFKMDDMTECYLYTENKQISFTVPAKKELREAYDTEWFSSDRHVITASVAAKDELKAEKNLALNPFSKPGEIATSYPHATASNVYGNSPTFWPRNAIDGQVKNDGHGNFPVHSWGPDHEASLSFRVSFGRKVSLSKIGILLRHDGTHDCAWKTASLKFSDGTSIDINLEYLETEQIFELGEKIKTDYVEITNLSGADKSRWPAITEFYAYGSDR